MDALTPSQREQLRLPLREGGLGLRAQASLREAAYLGSWLGNLEGVRGRCPPETANKARFTEEDRDWARALTNAQAGLGAVGIHLTDQGEVVPDPPQAAWAWDDDCAEVDVDIPSGAEEGAVVVLTPDIQGLFGVTLQVSDGERLSDIEHVVLQVGGGNAGHVHLGAPLTTAAPNSAYGPRRLRSAVGAFPGGRHLRFGLWFPQMRRGRRFAGRHSSDSRSEASTL